MLDSFNIKITKLFKLPQEVIDNNPEEYGEVTDLVTLVYFDYVATKHGLQITQSNVVHVPFVKDSEIIPFNELDSDTVVAWVNSQLTEEDIQAIKDEIEAELDAKQQEILDSKLPWEL